MSHWAEIDENKTVLRVLVGNNNSADEGESFMNSLGGTWVKTSYNGNIRKNFAGIGYIRYDEPNCNDVTVMLSSHLSQKQKQPLRPVLNQNWRR
jgi:hypothetical protein